MELTCTMPVNNTWDIGLDVTKAGVTATRPCLSKNTMNLYLASDEL